MVKSTFSLGGKLLTIFLTLVIFIGAIAGTLVVVYKNVKVRTLAGMLGGENWISEEYDDTIEGFVKKVTEALSGDISLNTLIEISPKVGDMLDGAVSNVEEIGLFKIDRDVLYATPVNELSGNVMNVVALTATLQDVADFAGFDLPAMPLIAGGGESPVDVYAQANATEDGSVDKAFSLSDTDYAYYTRETVFRSTYTQTGEDGTEEELPVAAEKSLPSYTLSGVTKTGNALYLNGARLYVGTESGDGAAVYYTPLSENNDIVISSAEEPSQGEGSKTYTCTFAPEENEALYVRTAVTEETPDGYTAVQLTATGKSVSVFTVALPYRYTALYAQVSDRPEGTEGEDFFEADGRFYVPANVLDEDGSPAVDTENGGFAVDPAFAGQTLYVLDYDYTAADASAANEETALYVHSDGVAGLPVVHAMNALTSFLNTDTMTLDSLGQFLDIPTDNAVFDAIRYTPFAYLSDSVNSALGSIYVDEEIGVDGSSPRLLLVLAYGSNVQVQEDGTVVYPEEDRRTIEDLTGSLDGLTVGDMVNTGDDPHPLLEAISGWTLDDIGNPDKLDSLTLGDVLGVDTSEGSADAKILQALADVPIGEIPAEIDNITLGDMVKIGDGDTLLGSLRGSTLKSLAEDLKALTVQQMFADDVYEYYTAGTLSLGADETAQIGQLKELADALAAEYGSKNLYVYTDGEYTPVYDFIGNHTDGEVPSAILSPYKKLTDGEIDDYIGEDAAAPLYMLGEDGSMISATQATGWKAAEEDKTKTLYTRKTDAEGNYVLNADGEYVYEVLSADADGIYATGEAWYFDAASEKMRRVDLLPAEYGRTDAAQGKTLFTRLSYADTYAEGKTYAQGNLFWYDTDGESWKQLPLQYDADAAAYTVNAEMLPEGFSLAADTRLYTYGAVHGIWKYLLTENGAEITCPVQQVNGLVSNVRRNINALDLNALHTDGMIEVSDPALLNTDIPYDLLGIDPETYGGETKVGGLSLNQLLDLTLRLLNALPGSGS
ncbi:MAG TPA: hypothetical protein H9726_03130 [Candidatus Borkfalkia avicola]|uniref:Uncharacterized protein n=1 Tax=Candidatus Borkfalkia avicola TaxID=2838503 RepID=A0A9D2IHP1_9FIRM|nr:hypothetical protein [Candidatus Borkfalkia avicola]